MKTNKKNSQMQDPFADILHVRRISTGNADVKNQTLEKSKKNHKPNVKIQLPDYERRKAGSEIENTGLRCFLPPKRNMTRSNEILNIPRQLKRASLGSEIKMISVNLPRFGRGEAIINSRIKEETEDGQDFSTDANSESIMQTFDYKKPSNVLEDAQKEIDLSQNQLQKIQSILKKKGSEVTANKPKWKNHSLKTETNNSKEKVISTLTTLNQKLNDIQQKYFTSRKHTYKSVNDISHKLRSQSISDVDISETTSECSVNIEDKDEIIKQYHLSKIKKLENHIFEERGTSVTNDLYEGRELEKSQKKKALNIAESSSDCTLPAEAKDRILEKFHLSKIYKKNDNLGEKKSISRYGRQLFDKGQNFSTTIPDVILQEDESSTSIQNDPTYDDDYDFDQALEKYMESRRIVDYYSTRESEHNNVSNREVESIRNLLLAQEEKSSERIKAQKSKNSLKLTEKESEAKQDNVTVEVKPVQSKSSETHYYDCDSKIDCPRSTISKKKIFFDNFGRYSNLTDRKQHKENINSVPNLSSSKFVSNESMRSDKEVFDNTPLQNAVLHSDFLTKTFSIDASGNFSESQPNEISKNKSDQFFNGGLDFKNSEAANVKGSKMTKDMYSTLSKALSNSFYKLSPQK